MRKMSPSIFVVDDTSPPPSKKARAGAAADASNSVMGVAAIAPQEKGQQSILDMFHKQSKCNKKDFKFVKKNASVTLPWGHAKFMAEIDGLRMDMHAAADMDNFVDAEEKKAELDELLPQALFEQQLYKKYMMTMSVAGDDTSFCKGK